VGLQTALRLRQLGLDPTVFEEHSRSATPKLCGGLISRRGAEELGLPLRESLLNEVRGARLYSPNGTVLTVGRPQSVAYVVDRGRFDQALLRTARQAGVAVVSNARLSAVEDGHLVLRAEGRALRWRASPVIGADGAASTVRRLYGMEPACGELLRTAQTVATGSFDPHYVEVHLGGFARGFFGWVIPLGHARARIGLGTRSDGDCVAALRHFLRARVPGASACRPARGLIPFGPPLARVQTRGAALVGDAAFHAKSTSGGGIIFGMRAAAILAESIAGVPGRGALAAYQRRLSPLQRELRMHWKIRAWLNALGDEDIDELFSALKRRGIERFLDQYGDMDAPSAFLARMASRPSFWFLARTLLSIALA